VDKALYVINGESGGNPTARGDGGAAVGLFQIHHNGSIQGRPDASTLSDAEANIKYAAQQLGAANGNWSAWGENNLYNGKPFGALGINPYPGGPVNGRASVAGGVKTQAPTQTAPAKTKPSIGSFLGTTIKGIGATIGAAQTAQAKSQKLSRFTGGYEPVGNFKDDVGGYFAASQQAWNKLAAYQRSAGYVTQVDEDQGIVWKLTGKVDEVTGEPETVVDEEATKILQDAMNSTTALDRLYKAKQAGIYDAGESAALAYLNSEIAKGDEATRKYEDMTTRIKDIVALEDLPVQRAQALASTLATINSANKDRPSRFSTMGTMPKVPKPTDFTSTIQGLKDTLPAQVPGFRDINPAALEPQPSAATNFMVPPSPQEIRSGLNSNFPMTGLPGPANAVNAAAVTQLPSGHPESTYGGPTVNKALIDALKNYNPAARFNR
jgi:hypothetical protein